VTDQVNRRMTQNLPGTLDLRSAQQLLRLRLPFEVTDFNRYAYEGAAVHGIVFRGLVADFRAERIAA
jgi:hypothetical protein